VNLFFAKVAAIRGRDGFFSAALPIFVSRAPGRLDLMGGNVDYTGGLVFQLTIAEATWAAAQVRSDLQIAFWNPQMAEEGWQESVEYSLNELTDEAAVRALVNRNVQVRWTAYVLGAFYWLRLHYAEHVQWGANVYIESEVPLNKGVSSSAAVEVAVMKAVAKCYGVDLAGIELAEACQWTENVIAESACGIMDQAASVLGDEDCVLPLLCQPCMPRPLVKLPSGLRCWAIDSGVRHAVTGIEYEAARAAAFVGYAMICTQENLAFTQENSGRIPRYVEPRWNGYLSNIAPSIFRSHYEQHLPETISGHDIITLGFAHPDPFTVIRPEVNYRVRACTRYAIEENQRIELFIELARGAESDLSVDVSRLLGDLMLQSHWSYTECGLGCDATDLLVDFVREECGRGSLFGAKITGGGGGGTVAVLGAADSQAALQRVAERYAAARGDTPYVFEGSSPGADRFGIRTIEAEQ
jgi:galactokinase